MTAVASSAKVAASSPPRSEPQEEGEEDVSVPQVSGPINLTVSHLTALSSRLFLSHLSSIPYSKTLILDPTLAGPLGLVVDTSSLKSVGVERMFWMEQRDGQFDNEEEEKLGKPINAPTKAIVYVCRPEEKWLRVIKSHIRNNEGKNLAPPAHTHHALLTPHRTELSLLSLSPVLPKLELYDFGIEFVPLEPDLLSLEEEGAAWKDLYITGDQTVLHRSAMALMTCQMLWGCFPKITGKGDYSRRLADLLMRQRREHLVGDPTNPNLTSLSAVVDGLVIVERGMDMATTMCSQLTYMGLLDEIVGIKSAHVEVDPTLLNASSTPQGPSSTSATSPTPLVTPSTARPLKKHRLDPTTDVLYLQIRDLNFSTVGAVLHSFAKRLSTSYQDRHSAKTVSEMRAFVGKLGGLQSEHTALRLHTALTEQLMGEANSDIFNRSLEIQQNIVAGVNLNAQMTAIEDLIIMEAPVTVVLRLLCLFSTTSGGLKPKVLDALKRDICQAYGYEHLTTLLNLERAGVLTKILLPSAAAAAAATSAARPIASLSSNITAAVGGGGLPAFERVRQPLRLINDEVSESDPTDVAYVYSGYAPLSIRVVQAVGQKEALVGAIQSGGGANTKSKTTSSGTGAAAAAGKGKGNDSRSKPRAHPLVGWKGFEDVLEAIPGETFDIVQSPNLVRTSSRTPPPPPVPTVPGRSGTPGTSSADANPNPAADRGSTPRAGEPSSTWTSTPSAAGAAPLPGSPTDPNLPWATDPDRPRTTIVFFLGGITYAEVAALRFMTTQSRNRRWLICTTGIISGDRIVQMAAADAGA